MDIFFFVRVSHSDRSIPDCLSILDLAVKFFRTSTTHTHIYTTLSVYILTYIYIYIYLFASPHLYVYI